ncbi:MAG TPA: helix-turn-helix domain-containing protein [Firmicutes bacterium]|nr:helix-turn-helix domain-containing protein [Bacillota bacterium]
MKELGATLKKQRLERGYSLADLEDMTKIRSRYLEAMEAGDFHLLPGGVYTRAFIRSYAAHVGLDTQDVLARFHHLYERTASDATQKPAQPEKVSLTRKLLCLVYATLNGTMEWLGL